MIEQTISHYPALWDSASMRDSGKRNKIIEKLGEGGMSPNGPRTLFVSDCRFEDPTKRSGVGGVL